MAFRALVAGLVLLLSSFSTAHAVVPDLRQPGWAELTQEQKQILAPLARDWDKMEAFRKKKWLGIAKRYPTMKPEEQARVQRRMQDWASLTPEQRSQARTQYKSLITAPPETKQAIKQKWEQYKELPDEEKKRLAKKAAGKPSSKAGMAKPQGLATKLPATPPQPLPIPADGPPGSAPASTPTAQDGATAPAEASSAQPAPATPDASSSQASQQ